MSEKTWEEDVIRRSEERPVLVDFWADWCQPCKQLTPVLEEAVAGRDVVLAKVDVEANKALAREYDVSGIPAVKGFRNGRVVAEFVGVRSRTAVDLFIDELTKPPVVESLEGDDEIVDALRRRDYERALQILLARAEDPERRDEARKLMVQLFAELGQDDPLAITYRKRLAALVY